MGKEDQKCWGAFCSRHPASPGTTVRFLGTQGASARAQRALKRVIDVVVLGCWVGNGCWASNGCWEPELAGWAAGERQATPERLLRALELNALKWVERINLLCLVFSKEGLSIICL